MSRRLVALMMIVAAGWFGCPRDDGMPDGGDDSGSDDLNPPITQGNWYRPPVATTWQWQLQPNAGGEINTSHAADAYDIDLFDAPQTVIDDLHARGRRVICYFSAGSYEAFRPDAGEFAPSDLGCPLAGFADERWLDIRAANVRRIMLARLDLAVQKGCDCVEPDNIDAYANASGFALTAQDQLDYNRFLANAAHGRGLCVGLKNDLDQVPALVAYFDFALDEQCHEFDECDALQPFLDADKPVFNAEYAAGFVSNGAQRTALCDDARSRGFHTLVLPPALDDSFRLSCDP
jgi:hypothetical protein